MPTPTPNFDNLIPLALEAATIVSRTRTGFRNLCMTSVSAANDLAKGQTLRIPFTQISGVEDVLEGTMADGFDNTKAIGDAEGTDVVIDNFKRIRFSLKGESEKQLESGGTRDDMIRQTLVSAMEELSLAQENAIADEMAKNAATAVGTAGSTPFESGGTYSMANLATLRKALSLRGIANPILMLTPEAEENFLQIPNLFKVNEAGNADLLRSAALGRIGNVDIAASSISRPQSFSGTVTGITTSGGDNAIRRSVVDTAGTNARNAKQGMFFTVADDPTKLAYGVKGYTNSKINIYRPGFAVAPATGKALTFTTSYTPNICTTLDSTIFANRMPAVPSDGDAGTHVPIMDENANYIYQFSMYRENRVVYYELSTAWGVRTINPNRVVVLLG